jgi:photosystem II stability/assembly factor-like uncharacterized protein
MMNRRFFTLITSGFALLALTALFWFAGETRAAVESADLPGLEDLEGLNNSPTITAVQPHSAPNDITTDIVIQGTGFTATISGTEVITAPMVYLGNEGLVDVILGSTTTLSATLPWGLEPGIYPLTVVNPDGISATLPGAFTVTNGIGVWTSNGPYGGKIGQLVVHPRQPIVIALGYDVGIFVSEDATGHWEMAFRKPSWHDEYTFDAQDDGVIYVGDDHGLYRTLDGSQTWEKISIRPDWWEHTPVAHPTLPGVVFAAVGSYLNPGEVGGVFRSDSFGTSWITLTEGVTDTHFTSLAIHPIYTQTLAAGTVSGNIFYSLDGGQTWDWSTQLTDTVAGLYFNPFEPLQVWATLGATSGKGVPGEVQKLYKSEDWLNWDKIETGAGLYSDGRFGWDMDFTPGKIWATTAGIYLSTDNGITWTRQTDGPCGAAGWLAINPVDPLEMYVGGDLGVCKSADGGLTWQQSNEGLAAIIPAETAVDPNDPETVYVRAGSLDLAKSENGGQAWRVLDIGIGGGPHVGLAVDPFISDRLYVNNMLSTDGGVTFNPLTFTLPITWTGWSIDGVTHFAPHPTQPGHILAGVGVSVVHTHNCLIYASDDYGAHWNFLGPTQPISGVVEIAYDALDPDLVYAATGTTGLWKSTNGGQSWATLTLPEDRTEVWEVFTHPDTLNQVYAWTNKASVGYRLFVSPDAGETWSAMPDGLANPFYFAPTQPTSLFAVCGEGNLALCRSWDGGYHWETVKEVRQEITTLSGGSDGERVIIYVGTKGGEVSAEPGAALALNTAPFSSIPGLGSVMGGGVYRLTTLVSPPWLYLPLIIK